MTIVVTVRVTDGIVLASDSATSFLDADGHVAKVYNNANKIFNLVKVWPIGAMTYGNGGIGTASISTLSKDLRAKLTPRENPDADFVLSHDRYTIQEVAEKAKRFFFAEYRRVYPDGVPNYFLGYRVCGYSAVAALPEAWEIKINGNQAEGPVRLYEDDHYGPRWAGENEALDRMILGVGSRASEAMQELGVPAEQAEAATLDLIRKLGVQLHLPAMPIQDAIDLARFLVDTAAKFSHFSLRPATVGGPIEIATITKHEGFKWISRKHYYTSEFNVGVKP